MYLFSLFFFLPFAGPTASACLRCGATDDSYFSFVRLMMVFTISVSFCFRFFVCVLYCKEFSDQLRISVLITYHVVLSPQPDYSRSGCKGECVTRSDLVVRLRARRMGQTRIDTAWIGTPF